MGTLYPNCVKTPKGIEEVERKVHGLALKSRQVLIMIDGKRDLATLQGIFPPAMVPGILDELIEGGFIRELQPPPVKEPAPAPVKPAARIPTASNDLERFTLARNFMLNTTSAFLGMAGSSLSEKIERTSALDELAPLYYAWYDAIALTGDGKRRLPELDQQLVKLLGELPDRAQAAGPESTATTATPAAPEKAAEPARRPVDDDDRLDMARNFMLNTTTTFVGMAGSALIEKIERSNALTELRHLYFDWRESLQLSKEGKQRLPELEKRLAALLS